MVESDSVMEFKTESHTIPHVRSLYKAKAQQSVEVHLCGSASAEKLGVDASAFDRLCQIMVAGFRVPALSQEDLFITQSAHLLSHLRSEWTRVGWLLEFRNNIDFRRQKRAFWANVSTLAEKVPRAELAIAMASAFTFAALGGFQPEPLMEWTRNHLPPRAALWIQRYCRTVLLSEFPGTKLYLLLEKELAAGRATSRMVVKRIFPSHKPSTIASAPGGTLRQRILASTFQAQYFFSRLRFHLREGFRYLLEDRRWRRLVKKQSNVASRLNQEPAVAHE